MLIDLMASCRHRAGLDWAEVVGTASAKADRPWPARRGANSGVGALLVL